MDISGLLLPFIIIYKEFIYLDCPNGTKLCKASHIFTHTHYCKPLIWAPKLREPKIDKTVTKSFQGSACP